MTLIAPHYNKAKKNSFISFLKKDRFLVKTPWWIKRLYSGCLWDMPKKNKTLYLTFDDGPHPSITSFILSELKKYNAKATFFCIGENVVRFPKAYQQMIDEGHSIANHTQHHINGWKSTTEEYIKDIDTAAAHINSRLFRPPYGRISRKQIQGLVEKDSPYTIVMWNVLAGDWVADLKPEDCYNRIKNKITDSAIIVLHDSDKAWDRMSYVLPRLLKDFSEKGYVFEKIEEQGG